MTCPCFGKDEMKLTQRYSASSRRSMLTALLLLLAVLRSVAGNDEVDYMLASRARREDLLQRNGSFSPHLTVPNVDDLSFFDVFTDFLVPGRPFQYSSAQNFRFQNSSGLPIATCFFPLNFVRIAAPPVTPLDI